MANFSGNKNNNEQSETKKIVKKTKIYNKLTPETKTVATQVKINNIDWPRSG